MDSMIGLRHVARLCGAVLCALGCLNGSAMAQSGGIQVRDVAAGSATFESSGSNTTIHAANQTIINYDRFDVAGGSSVQFVQPSATSRVLNRIHSAQPSRIDGSINANGVVYFVNPAGMLFGSGAVLNVGQIYAGAAQISDADFIAHRDRFTSGTGTVVQGGSIHADRVHLLGRHVQNHGSIVVPERGMVTMSAGDHVLIGERDGHVFVNVSSTGSHFGEDSPGVVNTGTISAAGADVSMAVGDVYSLAILNQGDVNGGRISLSGGAGDVRISGSLIAGKTTAGGTGGLVEIVGARISVTDALIDASGDAGGGTVHIGGDYQGGGDLSTATTTLIGPDVRIHADAISAGDGGEVVVWADGFTRFDGRISARGGSVAGDGGRAEVSGKETLVFRGDVDLRAPAGEGGNLLLDPKNIVIDFFEGSDDPASQAFDDNPGEDSFLEPFAIESLIEQTGSLTLQANNDIAVRAAIGQEVAPTGDLTLQAGRNVIIESDIHILGDLSITANEVAANGVVAGERDPGFGAGLDGGREFAVSLWNSLDCHRRRAESAAWVGSSSAHVAREYRSVPKFAW